jgi:hypothetical protein
VRRSIPKASQAVCATPPPANSIPHISPKALSEGYFFDVATLNWALGHHLTADAEISDPRLSALHATGLRDLPAHIHTGRIRSVSRRRQSPSSVPACPSPTLITWA